MVAPIISFDFSTIASYYSTGVSLGSTLHAEKLKNGVLKDILKAREQAVIPPWELPDPVQDRALANRVLSNDPVIDLKDPAFARDDLADEVKNLFALWKGLRKVEELTEFAQTRQGQGLSAILDRQLNDYISQIKKFVNESAFGDINLVSGVLKDTLDSTVVLQQVETTPRFTGQTVSAVRTDAIAGLTGTEVFTVQAVVGSTTSTATIDLANVAGTLNLDNIVAEANTQLLAAGIATTFVVDRPNETEYGIRLEVGFGETVSLAANAATESGAVYFGGDRGTGIFGGAFVSKLDDLSTADPTAGFYKGIDALDGNDTVNGVAVDSNGSVYVVGTAGGDLEGQINGGANDAFLRKYDAAGGLVYTQLLGTTSDAGGFAVAVDASDNVIVTGRVASPLTSAAYGGGYDTFVTKFDSTGLEQWTRQAAPSAGDFGLALTTDSSGNVYIGGQTFSAIATDKTAAGGSDGFFTKLDTDGTLVFNQQFGDTGDEIVTGIAVNSSGAIIVVGTDDGNGFLKTYAGASGSEAATLEIDLGALGTGGSVTGVALESNGDLVISGTTTNAALSGTVNTAHSGGLDGFALFVNGGTGAIDSVSYLGTAGTDEAFGLAVDTATDDVYITGSTDGTLTGETSSGSTDGFVTKLSSAGALQWSHQFNGGFTNISKGIAYDSNGTNVLSRLGLPSGQVPPDVSDVVTTATTVRDNQYFFVSVDDGRPKQITIGIDDSFGFLSFNLRKAIGTNQEGTALFVDDDIEGRFLRIQALNGHKIEILPGPEGLDALSGLGLKPTVLFGEITVGDKSAPAASAFGLELIETINVLTKDRAADADVVIENSERIVRKAFRFLTEGPEEPFKATARASQLLLNQIANYQAALDRLQQSNPFDLGGIPSLV